MDSQTMTGQRLDGYAVWDTETNTWWCSGTARKKVWSERGFAKAAWLNSLPTRDRVALGNHFDNQSRFIVHGVRFLIPGETDGLTLAA